MKILVTGFEPFGGEKINPALEVVKRLRHEISGAEVIKLTVPVVFRKSIEVVTNTICELEPDYVLSVGQAGGSADLSVERVGINIDDARISDNDGQQPIDTPIDPEGLPAFFATIPVKAIVQAIREERIPVRVSYTAGTFVCNHLMYGVLNHIYKNKLNIKAGFIHIPFVQEQVTNRTGIPSMPIEVLIKAIETAIGVIVTTDEDIKTAEGYIY
ncbi:pyroglutamyl-peptidase I [Lutispora saccharofermentans]|uniref:Pyrrolidone-carboxylate peptidase n=1 Tax=Lutispora saccharofermentans TaxID=3024236 RepID=A0ABT1NGN7_9FIRM|nr:pyroglutamyl-peptidase I [Lutispora saccharofermentans]